MNVLARFFLAASCVTVWPLGKAVENPDLSGLSKYLPTVGLLVGVPMAAVVYGLNSLGSPAMVTGVVVTLVWLVSSRCFHLDGLMDAADGIFSHRSKERMLEIMHDSRVGNFGVITGVMVILTKVVTLGCAPMAVMLPAVVLIPVWARFCEVFAIGNFPYARQEGMGKVWHDTTKLPRDIILSAIVPILLTACMSLVYDWRSAVCVSVASVVVGICAAFRINYVLGGHTGDTYGAVVELSESGALLCAMILFPIWLV